MFWETMIYLFRRYFLVQPRGKDHAPSGGIYRYFLSPITIILAFITIYVVYTRMYERSSLHDMFNGVTTPLDSGLTSQNGDSINYIQTEHVRKRDILDESERKPEEIPSIPEAKYEPRSQDSPNKAVSETEPEHQQERSEEDASIKLDPRCLRTVPEVDYGPHIVPPPEGPVTLVCCTTTAGILNIAVHPNWAPIGAKNFLRMVEKKFFSSEVALFRALENFLIQFGLAGDPEVQTTYEREESGGDPYLNLPDDPQWLPRGPPGRSIDGVPRFQKGYLSYAGGGANTRGTQLFITNAESAYLGGGSPWEVPIGQLVDEASYDTIDRVYTEYGESPSQGKIRNRGNSYLKAEFPKLDYILSCDIVAEDLPWRYEH